MKSGDQPHFLQISEFFGVGTVKDFGLGEVILIDIC